MAALQTMAFDGRPESPAWPALYADERLDALLSITGRMDGFLYRCKNDASYTMLYISSGILTLSGYPPEDFIHNRRRDYSSGIHPDDLADVYSAVDRALAARRNWNMDYRLKRRGGEPVWVREVGGGVFGQDGELLFLEGFVVDISDRKGIEDINIKLLNELKLANEELCAQKRKLELAKQQSDEAAYQDALTDLPNRRAFQEKLKGAVELSANSSTAAGLLFIDLDKFKEVNDTLGHEAGDRLLQRVSRQLRAILRSEDFVARVGGDEFAFLLFAETSHIQEKAASVARRILSKLQIAVPSPDGIIRVGCTVGIATCPADATDPEKLLTLADRLMYAGKKSGRNRVVTVTDGLESRRPQQVTNRER